MGLTHIYVASAVGIALVISIMSCNQAILKSDKVDYNMLRYMLMIVGISCFFDAVVFTADGQPGVLCRLANIIGNTVTYMLYHDDGSYCKCIESIQSLIHFLGATK